MLPEANRRTSRQPSGEDCASTAGGTGSIPRQETKIPHATWHSQKKKAERRVMWLDHTGGRVGVPPATQGVLFYLDFFKKINFIYLFIFGYDRSSFAVPRLSLVVVSRGYSLL